jgi:hypothetical protein
MSNTIHHGSSNSWRELEGCHFMALAKVIVRFAGAVSRHSCGSRNPVPRLSECACLLCRSRRKFGAIPRSARDAEGSSVPGRVWR